MFLFVLQGFAKFGKKSLNSLLIRMEKKGLDHIESKKQGRMNRPNALASQFTSFPSELQPSPRPSLPTTLFLPSSQWACSYYFIRGPFLSSSNNQYSLLHHSHQPLLTHSYPHHSSSIGEIQVQELCGLMQEYQDECKEALGGCGTEG